MDTEALNRRRGRFVPWIIAAFYLTFMTALVGFVFIAYAHPPSETTEDAYAKGLAYNDILAKAGAQAQLRWRSDIDYTAGRLRFSLTDHAGQPVTAARVKAWFVHPGNAVEDRSFDLRDDGEGRYVTDAPLPVKGVWTVHVTAEKAGRQYQSVTTVEVE
ncbi:hypothetical protein AEAC466_17020 [Asticcacaulis sp. AC466]|nr:hypothetical protein AEAC466_17020 [Asticcacaulis sp. AC466]